MIKRTYTCLFPWLFSELKISALGEARGYCLSSLRIDSPPSVMLPVWGVIAISSRAVADASRYFTNSISASIPENNCIFTVLRWANDSELVCDLRKSATASTTSKVKAWEYRKLPASQFSSKYVCVCIGRINRIASLRLTVILRRCKLGQLLMKQMAHEDSWIFSKYISERWRFFSMFRETGSRSGAPCSTRSCKQIWVLDVERNCNYINR